MTGKYVAWVSFVSLVLVSVTGCGDPAAAPSRQAETSPDIGQATTASADDVQPDIECTHESTDCYFNGTRNVVLPGHVHRPGCGHAWDGEHWVAVVPCTLIHKESHHCTKDCRDHYREGDRIVTIYGHVHHPGCGHLWDGENWLRIAKPEEDPNHPDYAGDRTDGD